MKTLYALGFIVGLALFAFGLWKLYHPAAYIMMGIIFMLTCLALNRSKAA